MTLMATPPAAQLEDKSARQWTWASGPCVAVEHKFELRVEPRGDFKKVFQPLIAPFQTRAGARPEGLGSYEVIADRTGSLPFTLRYDGTRLASGRDAHDLTRMFAWHVNQSVIRRSIPHHVLLHAAAARRGGITVILPADMESGKTTTVAGLLRDGFDYVTDEAVAIDPVTGWVTPFPKTLSLDPGSWPLFPECAPLRATSWARQWQVPVQSLGARPANSPVPAPRVIVFPKYIQGAATRTIPLSRGEAVQELARTTFEFPGYAGRNLTTLGRVAARATVARLIIGSLDDAVKAIETLVSEKLLEEL